MNPSSGLCLEVPPRQASSSGLLSQRDTRKAQPSGWKVTARGMQGPGSQLLHHSPFRRGLTCQKSYSRAGQSRARLEGLLGSGAESWLLPAAFVILGTLLHCPMVARGPQLHGRLVAAHQRQAHTFGPLHQGHLNEMRTKGQTHRRASRCTGQANEQEGGRAQRDR